MLLDALAVAALADELTALVGGRVQNVVQLDPLSVALEVYTDRRHHLCLSADPQREGVCLSAGKPRRGSGAPMPLSLALAARIEGARLTAVSQPPLERILRLDFEAGGATVIAEPMPPKGNVILVDAAGTIVAAARPVTAAMTRARVILPGRTYEPPPTPRKLDPAALDAGTAGAWLAAAPDEPAWRALTRHVRGASPLMAREAVARAAGDPAALGRHVDPAAAVAAMAGLFALARTRAWEPTAAFDGGSTAGAAPPGGSAGAGSTPDRPARSPAIIAYAPYRLTQFPDVRPWPSLSAAIEAFEAARLGGDPYRSARASVAARLAEARRRAERRVAALERERVDAEAVERWRTEGEWILALQHAVRPGDRWLEAPGDGGEPRRIALDPALTPVANAARCFDRYRRAKRAAADLPGRIAEAEARLATLEQLETDLALAEDRPGIDAVLGLLEEVARGPAPRPGGGAGQRVPGAEGAGRRSAGAKGAGRRAAGAKGAGGKAASTRPLRLMSSDGLEILVGRNSRQNEAVTFRLAARGDRWLHARGVPGAHVVVKSAGRDIPHRTLTEAAGLAAWYSRARGEARVDVAHTDVRHVRRLRGGGPGMVTIEHAATVSVAPRGPDEMGRQASDGDGSVSRLNR